MTPGSFDSLCIHFSFYGLRHINQPVFRTVMVQNLHEQQEVFTVVSISVVHAYDVFCNTDGFTVETLHKEI